MIGLIVILTCTNLFLLIISFELAWIREAIDRQTEYFHEQDAMPDSSPESNPGGSEGI
jgi:hypothetical protein